MGNIKPEIIKEKVAEIRAMMEADLTWHRTCLSREICEYWNWRGPNGQIQDIACRDMLRDLEVKGKIMLPKVLSKDKGSNKIIKMCHDTVNSESIMRLLAYCRILDPDSKRQTVEMKDCFFEHFDFSLDDAYDCLTHFSMCAKDTQIHIHQMESLPSR